VNAERQSAPGTWRLFLAVTPAEPVKAALAEVQERLRRRLPIGTVKWTPPDQLHLTLRFLGDVPAPSAPDVAAALARVAEAATSFALGAERLGVFPHVRRPRVIWVGLGGDLLELSQLQAAAVAATAPWGRREDQPFHAHLTLGRVRELPPARLRGVGEAVANCAPGRLAGWEVQAVELLRSELRPAGAIHTRLASAPLRRA